MTNLYNTNSPLNRAERKNVNDTWQDILSRFAQLQRHINFLAGEDVEEILQRIETAITNAQEATISANEAVEIINEELIKIATAISNAESARDQANTAADNATDAAQEVNIAKQNADVATLNANNAAEAANQAKQNTETATQEARTATTNANNATNAAERATTEAEAITEIMNTLKTELEVLQTALNGIVATENARVEVEEERVTNELARIEAEDERNEKERTRITTEINRVNAENVRVEAEGERVTNELARIEAEEERNEKETARTTAETNRVNAENTRVEAEEERTQAHHILRELLNNFQSLSYDASSTYDFPAIVSYNGSTYIALQEVTGIVPNNDGVNWRLVAQRGVDGDGSVSSINGLFPDPSGNVQLNVSSNWDSIEGKPSTFTPATHTHVVSDMDGLQSALDGKANSSHTHTANQITDLSITLANYSTTGHKHAISDVDGLQDALDNVAVDDTKYVFTDGSKAMDSITIGDRKDNFSIGTHSFAQGRQVEAIGQFAHSEGYYTSALGEASHCEGSNNIVFGTSSHCEGDSNGVGTSYSHAKGRHNLASNGVLYGLARTTRTGNKLYLTNATGLTVDAKVDLKRIKATPLLGVTITAIDGNDVTLDTNEKLTAVKHLVLRNEQSKQTPTYVEGESNTASGNNSHAEGYLTCASGESAHSEGWLTTASGEHSHAEGYYTNSTGFNSHSEGNSTTASGENSHAEGWNTTARGEASHAEGRSTTARGACSHAEGYYTTARVYASHASGQYNKAMTGDESTYSSTADAFVIGNGTSSTNLSNAFRVAFDGSTYGLSAFNSIGADYAEYFEWLDGNVDNEERIGFVVTLEGDKIRKANENDLYILGIISANPSVIGDSYQDDWQGKYVTDEWGRIQYHWVDVEHEEPQEPIFNEQTGEYEEQEPKKVTRKEYHPILNGNWSNETEYVPREQRPEWDAVGLVGKLYVRDDGTCQVNSYAKVGAIEGVLTNSHEPTNMRVMERVAPNIVRVFIK